MKARFISGLILALSIIMLYNFPNAHAATFDARVASSQDDAEQRSNGTVTISHSNLELMLDSSGVQFAVGMRWTNVPIPEGATITSAYISFTAAGTGSNPVKVRINGQASDNPPPFTTSNNNLSATSRPRTTAKVFWNNIPSWNTVGEEGLAQRTPNLSSIIQEIVDRPGWVAGNSIVLFVNSYDPANGPRVAISFDANANQAPLLHVEYTTPPPPVLADLSVTNSDTPDPVTVGNTLTNTLNITNNGPDAATNVVVTDTLPSGVTFISAIPNQGTCNEAGGVVTCNLGNLANGGQAAVTISVTPASSGTVVNSATVTSDTNDPSTADNTAAQETTVDPVPTPTPTPCTSDLDCPVGFVCDTTGGICVVAPTPTPTPDPTPTPTPGPTSTIPNFKVAFVGDLFLTQGTRDLYQLIENEGAQMLLLLGDLDHQESPDDWEQLINDILGPDFPVFAAIGNHETTKWDIPFGYQHKLLDRLADLEIQERTANPTCDGALGTGNNNNCIICSGDVGVQSACKYKGLFFILSGIGTWPVIDQRVASSSDDAEQLANNSVTLTSQNLELMTAGSSVQKAVGMRWTNVQIPKAAVITKATITFTTAAIGSNPVSVRINGEAADNAQTFSATNGNLSSRPKTTAKLFWNNIQAWNTLDQAGSAQTTPDISSIIQEIKDRPGWNTGNSIVLFVNSYTTDNGPRVAKSFDLDPNQAPRLLVEYYIPVDDHISYIDNQLAQDNSLWRVCAWHKAQRLMQVGNFNDKTGWGVYEACRQGGAIVGTAHTTTYSRTHLMSNFETQIIASTANPLVLEKSKSFDFVNGLGGGGIGPQSIDGNWWASVYASTCLASSTNCQANATYGALFCTFNINGQPDHANCYFKDINGFTVDAFDLISNVQQVP